MMKNLYNLKAAKTTFPGEDTVKIEVTDRNLWRKHLDQLLPLFAKVIFEEYEKEPFDESEPTVTKRALHQLQISFSDIDSMYALTNQSEFVGLIAIKTYKKSPKIGVVIEIIVAPQYRGKKMAHKLYELIFKTKEFYAIFGYSRYPAAVKTRRDVGNQFGYSTYFGGMISTNQAVLELQEMAYKYFDKEGIVSDLKAPQGFMCLKGEQNINSPLQEGEVKFKKPDPLAIPFQKILQIQKETYKDTVVGILVSIRE